MKLNTTISVIMPVYNGERFLPQAMTSLLNQTYTDFELIIVNDGSTDQSSHIINTFSQKDSRIRLIEHSRNLGVSTSLNHGLANARGELIFRMDADDIALPQRIAEQVAFMEEHPSVAVCGTWLAYIDESGRSIKTNMYYSEALLTAFHGLFFNPVAHPTVCFRKSVVSQVGGYRNKKYVEDFDLWSRILTVSQIAIVPKVLLLYRLNKNSVSSVHGAVQEKAVLAIAQQNLNRYAVFSRAEVANLRRPGLRRLPVLIKLFLAYAYKEKLSLTQVLKLLWSLRIYCI